MKKCEGHLVDPSVLVETLTSCFDSPKHVWFDVVDVVFQN